MWFIEMHFIRTNIPHLQAVEMSLSIEMCNGNSLQATQMFEACFPLSHSVVLPEGGTQKKKKKGTAASSLNRTSNTLDVINDK